MCEPTTIALGIAAFTGVLSAKSAYDNGVYQKGVADYNSRVLENQAQEVRNEGNIAENAHRQRVAELISHQRAQLGANSVSLGSGSALQLQEDTSVLGEADALRIRGNYNSKFDSLKTNASLTREEGKMAKKAGTNQAVGTLLATAGTMFMGSGLASKWFTSSSAANTAVNLNGSSSLKYIGALA